jgi:tRNA-modifying protein YgfZ
VSLGELYSTVSANGGVIDLANRTKLAVTGADRVRYLNGQITAKLTGKDGVQPACVTTAKGKLCADVFVFATPSTIFIDADPAVGQTLMPRLEKYIVADDVTIADVTTERSLIHTVGLTAQQILAATPLPAFPSNRLGQGGHDLLPIDRAEFAEHWEKLTEHFPIISAELAEVLRIERGIPRWGFELDENTLPAEAGLDRTHVDFHKGCYIGQEVISRVKSVGHVNRSLRGFISEAGTPLCAGSKIVTSSAPEAVVGTLTSATFSLKLNCPIALGFLKRTAPDEPLFAIAPEAPDAPVAITLHSLPF